MSSNDATGSISFFTGLAAEAWRRAKTAEDTAEEAAFLTSRLGLERAARLLDVPCGEGRLAHVLAAEGHRVTGVDGSAEALHSLRSDGEGCIWLQGDLSALQDVLEGVEAFDGAYCCGNALGYLDGDGTSAFFRAVGASLRRGARFVVDTEMTAESVLPNLEERLLRQLGNILMAVEHRYRPESGILETEYRFVRGAAQEVGRLDHHIFMVGDLCAMLATAGLDVIALESGMTDEPFDLGEPRLLLTAVRR